MGKTQPSEAPSSTPPSDKVEISSEARLVSELMSMPDVRQDKIDEIKRQIESGEYETPERLEKAVEQFLSENQDLIS